MRGKTECIQATPNIVVTEKGVPMTGVFSIRLADQKSRLKGNSQLNTINVAPLSPQMNRLPSFASPTNSKIVEKSGRATN